MIWVVWNREQATVETMKGSYQNEGSIFFLLLFKSFFCTFNYFRMSRKYTIRIINTCLNMHCSVSGKRIFSKTNIKKCKQSRFISSCCVSLIHRARWDSLNVHSIFCPTSSLYFSLSPLSFESLSMLWIAQRLNIFRRNM